MSKIAEKKVMELGYRTDPLARYEYSANDVFDAAVECYDQAMQDFMEKAEKWIEYEWSNSSVANLMFSSFKKYMQDEM